MHLFEETPKYSILTTNMLLSPAPPVDIRYVGVENTWVMLNRIRRKQQAVDYTRDLLLIMKVARCPQFVSFSLFVNNVESCRIIRTRKSNNGSRTLIPTKWIDKDEISERADASILVL